MAERHPFGATLDVPKIRRHSRFARFLPIDSYMGRANTSADALIEILSLCEQTLTALKLPDDGPDYPPVMDKFSHTRQWKRANIASKFVLIRGGLYSRTRDAL